MTFPNPLTESQQKLIAYLRQNGHRPEFAVARRQQWHLLLPMVATLEKELQQARLSDKTASWYITGLTLAGGGHLSEEQIQTSPLLSATQKETCLALARLYDQQRPRQMADEQPAVGQRITAKFKPDSYLGKYGSWHTGTVNFDPCGPGFSIPGTGGVSFDDIIEWLPAPSEEPHDVEKREFWEQRAQENPEYLTRKA